MTFTVTRRDGLTISDDPAKLDADRIWGWLASTLGVQRFVLATRDAHGVYAKRGFEPLRVPATWMEIDRRPNGPGPEDVRT